MLCLSLKVKTKTEKRDLTGFGNLSGLNLDKNEHHRHAHQLLSRLPPQAMAFQPRHTDGAHLCGSR